MENKIPQKSFDAQLHIIRDPRFDVDKYKVGELYVINNSSKHIDDNVWHINVNKVVGILKYVHEKFLTFTVLRYYEHDNTVSYNSKPLKIDIEDIIDKQIEIERLLTETEAAVYLMGAISKECAKDIIPESSNEKPVLADKYKGDLSHFILPNSFGEKYLYTDGTLKNIDMGEKQSTLDPKDPKFNRLLGIVPDYSQYPYSLFPYTLERTHSYQELQAAYKINTPEEAAEIAKNSQMNIVNDIMKSEPITEKEESDRYTGPDPIVVKDDTIINRLNYRCRTPGTKPGVALLFFKEDGSFACEFFDRFKECIKVTLKSEETTISFRTSPKNITANENTISMRNGNGTIKIVLHKDSFYKIFDEICFE